MGTDGQLRIVEVADVGEDAHPRARRHRADPGLAFALARLSPRVRTSPRRSACSAPSTGPSTRPRLSRQLVLASERKGPGDLAALLALGRHLGRQLTSSRRDADRRRSSAWVRRTSSSAA